MKNLLLFIVCLAAASAFGQFYHPDNKQYQTPTRYGLAYEEVAFKSADGTALHGWFVSAKGEAQGTVIHFHGNAQNMTSHFSFVAWLPANGYNLFVFDYRGYGKSAGKPTRTGVHADGVAALEYIKTRTDIDQERLFVLGQSLGGAVAIRALDSAGISGVRGVVVESTFDSYEKIAMDKAPRLLAKLVISDSLSPDAVVANLSPIPLVVIHGTADPVVPYARGQRLYKLANEPKFLCTIQGGKHTEAFAKYMDKCRPMLLEFFRRCLMDKPDFSLDDSAG